MSVSKSTAFLPNANFGNISINLPDEAAVLQSNFTSHKTTKVKAVYSLVYNKDEGTYTKQFN